MGNNPLNSIDLDGKEAYSIKLGNNAYKYVCTPRTDDLIYSSLGFAPFGTLWIDAVNRLFGYKLIMNNELLKATDYTLDYFAEFTKTLSRFGKYGSLAINALALSTVAFDRTWVHDEIIGDLFKIYGKSRVEIDAKYFNAFILIDELIKSGGIETDIIEIKSIGLYLS